MLRALRAKISVYSPRTWNATLTRARRLTNSTKHIRVKNATRRYVRRDLIVVRQHERQGKEYSPWTRNFQDRVTESTKPKRDAITKQKEPHANEHRKGKSFGHVFSRKCRRVDTPLLMGGVHDAANYSSNDVIA